MTQLARNVLITQSFSAPNPADNVTSIKMTVLKYENGVYTPAGQVFTLPYTGVETEISLTLVATTADTVNIQIQPSNSSGDGVITTISGVVLPIIPPLPGALSVGITSAVLV